MNTRKKLKNYEQGLIAWKKRKALKNIFNPLILPITEPDPKHYELLDSLEIWAAAKVATRVLKK